MYSLVPVTYSSRVTRRRSGAMVAPTHGVGRYHPRSLVLPGSYDLDDEGLGELGFLKKVGSAVKSGAKKVGKIAKKAAPIAIPIAGVALAPFTGGASLAVAAAASGVMAATGKTTTAEKVGMGIVGAGAVGYGAYQYSQTGQIPGAQTAGKVVSGVRNFFGGGGQTSSQQQAYPPQTVLQPPQVQAQANPLWVQQTTRPPVVTYVQSPSYPPSSAQMRTQFVGGGMQQRQDPMELYREQEEGGMTTGAMVAIGATVVGGVVLATMA